MTGQCKVDLVADRYELTAPGHHSEDVDAFLVEHWTGAAGEPMGYHALTDWFNRRLLKQVYERAGRETIGTRVESEYDALRGDDELVREEVMDDVESDGIDAEAIVEAMVSWSTMRRHLQDCLEAEKPSPPSRSNWEMESVEIARERTAEKTVAAVRSLARKGRLPDGDAADVDVQIKLSCPECPTRVPLEAALARGYVCEEHVDAASVPGTEDSTPAEIG